MLGASVLGHIEINGYANGWLLDSVKKKDLSLVFGLDRYVLRGIVFSIVGVIFLVLIIMYLEKKPYGSK